MNFYDSDLQSDNPDDFESDHEAPKDYIKDVKLISKDPLTRINKQIFKCGRGLPKPAKCDIVLVKHKKLENDPEPQFKEFVASMKEEEPSQIQLGLAAEMQHWWELTVESMKKGEVSSVKIEHLKYDDNGMKVLDKEEFYMFEVVDWITCIDLNMDEQWYKYIKQKGVGQNKPDRVDEVQFSYTLKCGKNNEVIAQANYEEPIVINQAFAKENENKLPSSIFKIMRHMKQGEIATCKFTDKVFQEKEEEFFRQKSEQIKLKEAAESVDINIYAKKQDLSVLQKLKEQVQQESNEEIIKYEGQKVVEVLGDNYWVAEIEIKQITKVDDIFRDQSALRRTIYNGENSSKIEKLAKVQFEIEIYVQKKKIYSSIYKNLETQEKQETRYWNHYLDDYEISKLLRNSLRRMKRKEVSSVQCNDNSLIQNGKDYEILMKKFNGQLPSDIFYVLKVLDYTEGKNNFNMTIDEKITHAQRKKEIGIKLIKEKKNYKKALKVFETINAFFEFGKFYEEDKIAMYEHKLSSLLNTSLCYQQMQNWNKVILVCGKIFELTPGNAKAAYRKALAMQHNQEFKEAGEFLSDFLQQFQDNIDKDLLKDLQKLQQEITSLKNKHNQKEKKLYKQMFEN